ncbi:hypothetical protein GCM10022212_22430 [Actimicrobium antarcticum]|uniref:Uncharacterized protein n=2 Tax=Actimicrobium antarcticum TaxID=1051899 RepID=A0ABP7TCJ8_9BURK
MMHIDDTAAEFELAMEGTLCTPAIKPVIADMVMQSGAADEQDDLATMHPLQQSLAELVAYLRPARPGSVRRSRASSSPKTKSISWRCRRIATAW